MRFFKFFLFLTLVFCLGTSLYYYLPETEENTSFGFFETETPVKKIIKQHVTASGQLKLKDEMKIGSSIKGKIKAIHVREGDFVREGELLVEIETPFGDTELREAEGAYERAVAEKDYAADNYTRKKLLFDEAFLSEAELQEAWRQYKVAQAEEKSLKASYDAKLIAYEHRNVYAPSCGVIIKIFVSKGEKVSDDLEEGRLISLVPDTETIEAQLLIDERQIGQIRSGLPVEIIVDSYPSKVFKSFIDKVSFTAEENEEQACIYQAKSYIDNRRLLLRPGMSVTAKIAIGKSDAAWTMTSRAFGIKQHHLEEIAENLNMPLHPIKEEEKDSFLAAAEESNIQYVWQLCDDCLKELAVVIGIDDAIAFEVKKGLTGDEKLIVDVPEVDAMKKIYDRLYRKL